MCKITITYVILREVDGFFGYRRPRNGFHEQTGTADVELIVDGEACFVLREHHIVGPENCDR